MSNVPLSDFLHMVMLYCPTAPEPILIQHLRLAAREFCKDTRCWREVVTVPITENPVTVRPSCTGANVVAVQSAMLNGRELRAVPFDQADIEKYMTEAGRADQFTQDTADRFIIMPFEAGDLTVSAYFAPTSGTLNLTGDLKREPQNQVPAFLLTEHAEAIAHGALSRVMAIPRQEWSDGNMAGYFKSMFNEAKGEVQAEMIKGKQRAPIRTTPRWM